MCLGNIRRKEEGKRGVDAMHDVNNPHDYSHIFNEIETQMILHRALLMQRLVQDPFYAAMNVTPAARMWMLRHLPHLAEHADHRYHINLMQFFEFLGREEMVKFLRYKNAPSEMLEMWDKMYPPSPSDNFKLKGSKGSPPRNEGNPAKRRRI